MKVKQKIKEEPNLEVGKLEVEDIKKENEDLTAEDEERRRRRRERNKVAATKCRNKKKERTTLLIAEGEVLEIQNSSFKEELIRLEAEKRRLTEILAQHEHTCVKRPRLDKDPPNRDLKDVFKVPNAPTPKENHQPPTKLSSQKVEHFETQRKYPAYNGNANTDNCDEQPAFSNEFQYFNYGEGFDHQRENNMFVKQQPEQHSTVGQGYYHYSFYGANLKNNFLDSQPLSLSSYGFSGVDNMCVAL